MDRTRMDAFNQGSPSFPPPRSVFRDGRGAAGIAVAGEEDGPQPCSRIPAAAPERQPMRWDGRAFAATVAAEVVPLLVLAHRRRAQPARHAPAGPPGALAEAIPVLADLAVRSEVDAAVALVEDLHWRGHSFDDLYLELISGVARHLGQLWHEDRLSFADVTIGTLALQRLLHALDHAFCACAEVVHRDPAKRALLASRPGEPHGFALDMLSAFLRRAGWEAATIAPADEAELCDAVRSSWYAVLGLSDSCGLSTDGMAGLIHAARRASLNRHLRVMVGGPAFAGDPEEALRVGADATAVDARHAVDQAEALFALVRRNS